MTRRQNDGVRLYELVGRRELKAIAHRSDTRMALSFSRSFIGRAGMLSLILRSLKQTLQMDVLRCKTPELVRKELWTHILAYNLIRTIIAQAATKHGVEPRTISFKGAVQTLEAFQPMIALQGEHNSEFRNILYEHLLDAIANHRVANRPDR